MQGRGPGAGRDGKPIIRMDKEHASTKTKEYLGKLPVEITFTVHDRKVALFHATPRKNNLYWFEDRPEKFFQEMAEKVDADILIYGHTHKPYRKDFGNKIFIKCRQRGQAEGRRPAGLRDPGGNNGG